EDLAFDVDRDLLRQIACRHRLGDVGDVAHLGGQIARHRVHAFGQVLPGAGHALNVGLATEPAFAADLASDARHLGSEGSELVDDGVDGVLQLRDLALHIDGDLFGKIAGGDRGGDLGDVAYLGGEISGHRVHAFGEILPGAGHALNVGLATEPSFGADL